jgi:ribosome-associated protein
MEAERPSIRLDQFMKLVGLARSGGEAKHLIQEGQVRVNGAVEVHRSHKLFPGDVVQLGPRSVTVEQEQLARQRSNAAPTA